MIYVKEGHKKDMWFICQDHEVSGNTEILRVFYSKHKADDYVRENKSLRGQHENYMHKL